MATSRTHAEAAFWSLRADDGTGIRTSNGDLFNHTIFARDVSMIGRWIIRLGKEYQPIAREIILTLAYHQGVREHPMSEEQPGRIHNEYRDYKSWEGPWWVRAGGRVVSLIWGGGLRHELTYIALDTTPLFILLVCRYVELVGPEILEETVLRADGRWVSIQECLESSLDWLASHRTHDGFIAAKRRNPTQLFYQTWRDSHTAYIHENGKNLSLSRANIYLEPQFLAVDAWRYAARYFPDRAELYRGFADQLRDKIIQNFWDEETQYFWGALEPQKDGSLVPMKTPTSAAGWLLDSTVFYDLPEKQRQKYITGIINRLAQEDFVTPVGLRCRARGSDTSLGVADYHGSWTVWPVDSFVYARGLHRQGFDKLAREHENRLFAGINTTGSYNEYFLVTPDNKVLYHPHHIPKSYKGPKVPVQIIPEHNLAWTIAAALLIERGELPTDHGRAASWQPEFESEMIKSMPEMVQNPLTEIPFRPANVRGAFRIAQLASRKWVSEYIFKLPTSRKTLKSPITSPVKDLQS